MDRPTRKSHRRIALLIVVAVGALLIVAVAVALVGTLIYSGRARPDTSTPSIAATGVEGWLPGGGRPAQSQTVVDGGQSVLAGLSPGAAEQPSSANPQVLLEPLDYRRFSSSPVMLRNQYYLMCMLEHCMDKGLVRAECIDEQFVLARHQLLDRYFAGSADRFDMLLPRDDHCLALKQWYEANAEWPVNIHITSAHFLKPLKLLLAPARFCSDSGAQLLDWATIEPTRLDHFLALLQSLTQADSRPEHIGQQHKARVVDLFDTLKMSPGGSRFFSEFCFINLLALPINDVNECFEQILHLLALPRMQPCIYMLKHLFVQQQTTPEAVDTAVQSGLFCTTHIEEYIDFAGRLSGDIKGLFDPRCHSSVHGLDVLFEEHVDGYAGLWKAFRREAWSIFTAQYYHSRLGPFSKTDIVFFEPLLQALRDRFDELPQNIDLAAEPRLPESVLEWFVDGDCLYELLSGVYLARGTEYVQLHFPFCRLADLQAAYPAANSLSQNMAIARRRLVESSEPLRSKQEGCVIEKHWMYDAVVLGRITDQLKDDFELLVSLQQKIYRHDYRTHSDLASVCVGDDEFRTFARIFKVVEEEEAEKLWSFFCVHCNFAVPGSRDELQALVGENVLGNVGSPLFLPVGLLLGELHQMHFCYYAFVVPLGPLFADKLDVLRYLADCSHQRRLLEAATNDDSDRIERACDDLFGDARFRDVWSLDPRVSYFDFFCQDCYYRLVYRFFYATDPPALERPWES